MKSLSEMTLQEYSEMISALIDTYRKESTEVVKPTCFYYNGIKFDKNTPDELWGELLDFKNELQ